jgi:hypothetical protein
MQIKETLINDIEHCWNSMRQKLQSKLRVLKTVQPYPDTVYMRDYIDHLIEIVEAALEQTYIIQDGISNMT